MTRARLILALELLDSQPKAAMDELLLAVEDLRARHVTSITVLDVLRAATEPLGTKAIARELAPPGEVADITATWESLLAAQARGEARRIGSGPQTAWTVRRASIGGAA